MSKMIQVRNVPDAVHKRLKIRAAHEGVSLSDARIVTCDARLAGAPGIRVTVDVV